MATIRHSLHQEILQPLDERLLAYVQVNKALKKKNKPSYLVVSVTKDPPTVAYIHQVKKSDKYTLKKKQSWPLNALKAVDGKSSTTETLDFDLHLDKIYKWTAENGQERKNFITVLYKESSNFPSKDRPVFIKVPKEWITTEMLDVPVSNGAVPMEVSADAEDYQALSEKEEADLQQLMSQCGFAVSNAEQFIDTLAKHLSILDGENVQSVLASEQQVAALMRQIDTALEQVSKVEAQLQSYDDVLCHIRTAMDKMEEKNTLIAIANKNNHKLLMELENIVHELELPSKHQIALTDADLTSPQSLQDAIAAAKALQKVMNAKIHPGLLQLAAVQDQKKRFEKWKTKFSQILSHHLNNMFIYLGNDPGEFRAMIGPDLVLPKHTAMHRELSAYTELMHWCKAMDRKAFNSLTKVYTNSISKLYERDVKQFLEDARQRVAAGQSKMGGSKEDVASKPWLSVSVSSKSQPSASLLGVDRELWAQEVSPAERLRFDQVFERVLSELEPVCLSEQNFCVHFFELGIQKLRMSQSQSEDALSAKKDDPKTPSTPQKKIEKQMHEEVRKMMAEIFNCIEPEILNFLNHHEKIDPVFRMYGLVRLSQHVMSAQDTGSFLSMTFGTILVQVKRNYDRYMQTQLNSIQDCRPVRKGKCGILPFVYNFEEFARTTEQIFKDTERRADLDKWYIKLVGAIFEAIPIVAADHPKTPPEVIKMENFHHLYDLLSRLKIGVLDSQRKEAKVKYNEALKAYVTRYFGRPLEKLNLFFEGVQAKVAQGVKESEISYQMAFSKQELRKVVKEYPGKEVHRGLEQLYRKVEKHLCEEENLLQVVWRAMQEEFIVQYKHIDDMIQRCYPGSMVTLDFTIDNILQFFSEIARSH
nr:PREDICTED: exocyst complex component 1 isoform X2 [Bemisia tabaci]